MILVDTSVWIDHLHEAEPELVALLSRSAVARHPMVVGELALGNLKNRSAVLAALAGLPALAVATHEEVLRLIEQRELFGTGLSLVDAHLLASVLLSPGSSLWTRDKRLSSVAASVGLTYSPGI
jgi:predicted nucleic acid-binding protein